MNAFRSAKTPFGTLKSNIKPVLGRSITRRHYTQAMQQIEESVNDLAHSLESANAQQREQLHRMRLQLQHLQNEMILLEHDPSTVGGNFIE